MNRIQTIFNNLRNVFKRREYEVTKTNRVTHAYPRYSPPANNEIKGGLVGTRAIARHLIQNNSLGTRYINLCKKNIPGPYGFTLDVKAEQWDSSGKPLLDDKGNIVVDKIASRKIINAWLDWAQHSEHCDVSESKTLRAIQHMVVKYLFGDGEYLVRKIYDKSKYGFRLQVLEPDLIDESYTTMLNNGNAVIMGVEYDVWFKRVALYLRKPNLGTTFTNYQTGERDRVSIKEFYYDFNPDRAFAARGISPMTPSMLRAMLLWDYEKAAGTNAINSARRLGFISKKEDEAAGAFTGDDADSEGNPTIEVEEMSMFQLDPGYSVEVPDPKYPDAQYEMFTKVITKFIASGWDLSYITLANDLTETSYGSGRIGLMDEQEGWRMKQEMMIESLMEPVYRDWLHEAILIPGLLDLGEAPYIQFERFNKPYFHGKKFDWIAPEKDAQAIESKSRMGLTSPIREAAKQGDNFYELIDEMAEALRYAGSKGITLDFGSDITLEGEPAQPPTQTEKKKREAILLLRKAREILNSFNGELEHA